MNFHSRQLFLPAYASLPDYLSWDWFGCFGEGGRDRNPILKRMILVPALQQLLETDQQTMSIDLHQMMP